MKGVIPRHTTACDSAEGLGPILPPINKCVLFVQRDWKFVVNDVTWAKLYIAILPAIRSARNKTPGPKRFAVRVSAMICSIFHSIIRKLPCPIAKIHYTLPWKATVTLFCHVLDTLIKAAFCVSFAVMFWNATSVILNLNTIEIQGKGMFIF